MLLKLTVNPVEVRVARTLSVDSKIDRSMHRKGKGLVEELQ